MSFEGLSAISLACNTANAISCFMTLASIKAFFEVGNIEPFRPFFVWWKQVGNKDKSRQPLTDFEFHRGIRQVTTMEFCVAMLVFWTSGQNKLPGLALMSMLLCFLTYGHVIAKDGLGLFVFTLFSIVTSCFVTLAIA